PIPADFLPQVSSGRLSIYIDDPTTGAGDGFAIDFVRLLINPRASKQVGTVSGKVTDAATGQPISGVTVSASGVTAQTGSDGLYTLTGTPAGLAVVTATKNGYTSLTLSADLVSGASASLNFALRPAPATGTTPSVGATPGLVAYYPLDGDARDYSGNDYHGMNSGGVFVPGRKGQALKLDGVNNYVSAPVNINPDVMPQMTMAAWVQASKSTGTIISHDDGGFDRTMDIDDRGGGLGWSAFTGSGVLGYRPVTVGDWVFVAAVYDQNARKVTLYVNDSVYEKAGTVGSGWKYINIGRNPSFGGYFPGAIDEVRIYSYALSAGEIASLRSAAGPVPVPGGTPSGSTGPDGIVGYWKFDETSGNAAADSSGLGNNGAVKGTASWTPNGRIGGALTFDGKSNYVLTPVLFSQLSSGMTWMAWAKHDAPNMTWSWVFSEDSPVDNHTQMGKMAGSTEVVWGPQGVGSVQTKGMNVADGQWHHIAGVWEKGVGLRLYIDGALKASGAFSGSMTAKRAIRIGAKNDDFPAEKWKGAIDEARIYNRALSADDISAAMGGAGPGPSTAPTPIPTPQATPTPPARQVDTTLIADERVVAQNGAVALPIRLEKASRLGSLNFSIEYDPAVVKVNRVDGGDLVGGSLFQSNTRDAGTVRFGIATQGTEGVNGDGPVAYVVFTATGPRSSASAITLGDLLATDSSGGRVGLNLRNGKITIGTKVKGDYDGDGRLTAKDALAALKMSVKDLPEDLNLDMDNDGKISAEDARRILAAALGSGQVTSQTPPAAPGLASTLDSGQTRVTGALGGSVSLQGGARVDIPARAIDSDAAISLVRKAATDISARQVVLSDAYYLTSQDRPQVKGEFTLGIPYDRSKLPQGVSEDSLQAYAVTGNSVLFPVASTTDKNRQLVVVRNPEVAVLGGPAGITAQKRSVQSLMPGQSPEEAAPPAPTGYVIGKAEPTGSGNMKCQSGAPGEVHEEDNQVFRILFLVQSPCSFAKFVSVTLTEALDKYNTIYMDTNGKAPFANLSPDNRMVVQLGSFPGVNGEYKFMGSWNGYILIDVPSGMSKQTELRDTLFHEMFHAVQDIYSNMFVGGIASMWWYEATAEWAGMTGRGLPFAAMIDNELATYPYVLSAPIQQSRSYEEGRLSYGYSLLIEHVQRQKPGYLRNVLNSWKTTSGQLYNDLVAWGNLGQTYPAFVGDVLVSVPGGHLPWTQARIFETNAETRIFSRPTAVIGDRGEKIERLADEGQRSADHHFVMAMPPLTARFFQIQTQALTENRRVEVRLARDNAPSDNAWLMTTLGEGVKGPQSPPSRLGPSSASFPGLGKSYASLWVAVFNPDPSATRNYDLAISLKGDKQPPQSYYYQMKKTEVWCGTIARRVAGDKCEAPAPGSLGTDRGVSVEMAPGKMIFKRKWQPADKSSPGGTLTGTVTWGGLPISQIQPGQAYNVSISVPAAPGGTVINEDSYYTSASVLGPADLEVIALPNLPNSECGPSRERHPLRDPVCAAPLVVDPLKAARTSFRTSQQDYKYVIKFDPAFLKKDLQEQIAGLPKTIEVDIVATLPVSMGIINTYELVLR
ncbi:MAG: carboxypeptidase regulatory-like domain-containing protein, partial [Chloroflexi bacterium]|nr:carboxypeptidase regulatory-like domain-containing protein [Chloroflexota bacterium]